MKISRVLVPLCFCAALGTGAPTALAQTNSSSDTRIGCIYHGSSGIRFIDNSTRTREQILSDAQAAAEAGKGIGDPCLNGQMSNMPAAAYALLAKAHPETYQPLPAQTTSLASPAVSAAVTPQFSRPKLAFINLDAAVAPGYLFFDPLAPLLDGRVFGTVYDNNVNPYVGVYQRGTITAQSEGVATAVSHLGFVGGYVVTDPVNYYSQAAIFRGNNVQLIPRAPGEISSSVVAINDFGLTVVASQDANYNNTLYLLRNGVRSALHIGKAGLQTVIAGMNDWGVIVGWQVMPGGVSLAYKYATATGVTTNLPPLSTEPNSWALGINELNDVVGYSFIGSGIERIGFWHATGGFDQYFVEGTATIPTISNALRTNDLRQIVITFTNDGQSYLVPQKNVRVPLANYIAYDPTQQGLPFLVYGINDFGAFTGTSSQGIDFLAAPKLP
jgi:hypothetical protein